MNFKTFVTSLEAFTDIIHTYIISADIIEKRNKFIEIF